jgi:glycosyltransferase involved in cell wall biosynthesis
MRILLIHQYFLEKNDGGGSRWNEMSSMWAAAGHEITVLAGMVHYASGKKNERYKGKYFFSEQFEPGIDIIRCHVSEAYNINFIGRLWAYFSFVFSSIYAGLFKVRGQYDVILVTSPPLFVGITAYVLSRFKRTPYLLEIRDLWPESAIDTGVLRNQHLIRLAYKVESFLYKKASKINVLTPAFRQKLLLDKHVTQDKIIYVPNAADFRLSDTLLLTFDAAPFRKKYQMEGRFVVTYVGAHGVANHLDQVLDAAKVLKFTHPEVLFLLIGEGMEKARLKALTEQSGLLGSMIRFIDAVPKAEVFQYIMASDLGASILKKNDTFKTVYSNKTFDYMACKKPVLMLIDGASRELVEKAECGTFVPPEDTAAFVAAVEQYLLLDKLRLLEQGERGYQYAKANFDRSELSKQYLKHVMALVDGK